MKSVITLYLLIAWLGNNGSSYLLSMHPFTFTDEVLMMILMRINIYLLTTYILVIKIIDIIKS